MNQITLFSTFRLAALAALAGVVSLLAACSSIPANNSRLDEARSSYQSAAANPQVTTYAAGELKQASMSLDSANRAFEKNEPLATVDHLSYITGQHVAIAVETSRQKAAEQAVKDAGAERDRVRLELRTREADSARQGEASAKQSAEYALKSAEASQRQSAIDRQNANTADLSAQAAFQQVQAAEARSRELELRMQELEAKKTPRGMVVTLGDVLFDTDRAQLKSSALRNIQKLSDFFKQYPQRSMVIEGFTDSTGTETHNQELSERRAAAVRTALADMGISMERISARGYGEAYPVGSNSTAEGRQLNRRVEVVISDDGKSVPLR
ncbi:MAG: OmpA family protein [Aeromicrobium sp.]|nr:OmpA family protein [Burkholderiales bacterium]